MGTEIFNIAIFETRNVRELNRPPEIVMEKWDPAKFIKGRKSLHPFEASLFDLYFYIFFRLEAHVRIIFALSIA